ncbi:MAG: hypothetical protein V8R46_02530 [Eubacterium ramulus]
MEDRHDASPLLKQMLDEGKNGFRAEAVIGVHEGFMKYTSERDGKITVV